MFIMVMYMYISSSARRSCVGTYCCLLPDLLVGSVFREAISSERWQIELLHTQLVSLGFPPPLCFSKSPGVPIHELIVTGWTKGW